MIHTFKYDGRALRDFGAVISEPPHFAVAVRDMDMITIPGHSGDMIYDKKRFKNAPYSFKVSHVPTFSDLTDSDFVAALAEWLLSDFSYKPLRDTFHPGYFRKAVCKDIGTPIVEATGYTRTTITFDCAPFWFSDAGAQTSKVNASSGTATWTFHNPEKWASEPIIKINGSGNFAVTIGSQTLTLTDVSGTAIIDKPAENVYDGSGVDINDKVTAVELPVLPKGSGSVVVTGSGSFSVEITPNWWRLC